MQPTVLAVPMYLVGHTSLSDLDTEVKHITFLEVLLSTLNDRKTSISLKSR